MKKLLFILFSFFIQFGFGQNWELFPEKQFSNFETDHYYDTILEIVVADTIILNGDVRTTYFKYENTMSAVNDCTDEISDYVQSGFLPVSQSGVLPHLDSIIEMNDTSWLYNSSYVDSFPFLTHAILNQKWYPLKDHNDLYVKCIFSGTGEILGITDSIKKFKFYKDAGDSPLNDFTIILSKNYGLVDFLDFDIISYNPDSEYPEFHHLIGFRNDSTIRGYQIPVFEDFFPATTGDILIWTEYLYNPDPFYFISYHIYYKDSILQKSIFFDSIVYVYDEWKKDTDGVITFYPDNKIVFQRQGFEPLMKTIPGWIGLAKNNYCMGFDEEVTPIWKQLQTNLLVDMDTTVTLNFSAGEYYLNTMDCVYSSIADFGADFSINDQFGVTSHGYLFNEFTDNFILTGSILNGIVSGDIDFNTLDIPEDNYLKLNFFPNPANNFIQIDIPTNKSFQYSIFTFDGKIISTADLKVNQINVQNLIPGIYILELKNDKRTLRGKFIKQ